MTRTKAILVVSFGSTYADTIEKNITAIEQTVAERFPDYRVCRAFTGRRILKVLRERDGLQIDSLEEALDRLERENVRDLVVLPTYVMKGTENDDMVTTLAHYQDHFDSLRICRTLLEKEEDLRQIVTALAENYRHLPEDTGLVLMGHGTDHYADEVYQDLDRMFRAGGHDHIFMVTMKGRPSFEDLTGHLEQMHVRRVLLVPLMVVAGKHARRDMAGEDGHSIESMLRSLGYEVECRFVGLGEYSLVRDIYCQHVEEVLQ